jgi:hypothetical protein
MGPEVIQVMQVVVDLIRLALGSLEALAKGDMRRVQEILPTELRTGLTRSVRSMEEAKKQFGG